MLSGGEGVGLPELTVLDVVPTLFGALPGSWRELRAVCVGMHL